MRPLLLVALLAVLAGCGGPARAGGAGAVGASQAYPVAERRPGPVVRGCPTST